MSEPSRYTLVALGVVIVAACSASTSGGVVELPDERDSATHDAAMPAPDPVPVADAGAAAAPPVPSPPQCAPSTLPCLSACAEDERCVGSCFDVDPDCGACVNRASHDCAIAAGCTDEIAASDACIGSSGCGDDDACNDVRCPTQIAALDACIPEATCAVAEMACFD